VTRINSPKRYKRHDLRKTGSIWSGLRVDTRDSIWRSLRSDYVLSPGFQWVLQNAEFIDPGPSLFVRSMMRLSSDLDYIGVRDGGHNFVFVAMRNDQGRGEAVHQSTPDNLQIGDDKANIVDLEEPVIEKEKTKDKESVPKEKKKKRSKPPRMLYHLMS
jgi:hypothetical protein